MLRLRFRSRPPAASAATDRAEPFVEESEEAVGDVLVDGEGPRAATDTGEDAGSDERRSTPRRDVPLGPAVRAEFMLLGRFRSLHVDDVSLGGLGLRGSIEEGRGLFLGQRIAQARVMVGDQLVLVADLEVRIRRSFRSFLVGEQVHIGCRFLGLDPRAEAELQRMLSQLLSVRQR